MGNNLSILNEREHRKSHRHHWCLSLILGFCFLHDMSGKSPVILGGYDLSSISLVHFRFFGSSHVHSSHRIHLLLTKIPCSWFDGNFCWLWLWHSCWSNDQPCGHSSKVSATNLLHVSTTVMSQYNGLENYSQFKLWSGFTGNQIIRSIQLQCHRQQFWVHNTFFIL